MPVFRLSSVYVDLRPIFLVSLEFVIALLQCDEESWFNSQQEEEIFLYFMMSWLAK
jgi:hypothetical protein